MTLPTINGHTPAVTIDTRAAVYAGNSLEVLVGLPDNSIDSIVTDPPYELGFMGKTWDNSGIAYSVELWQECLRVLKPGGHILAFGGSRTWHRLAVAIDDAGFEIRDSIAWIYGSGFPKSLDISKAIDKAAGATREVVGETLKGAQSESTGKYGAWGDGITPTAPATAEAQQWAGWGTALKPAFEPVVVGRKPLIGTVAANVLAYGTGGLNIDGTRIGTEVLVNQPMGTPENSYGGYAATATATAVTGRWPSNVILDEHTANLVDQQSGVSKNGKLQIGAAPRTNVGHKLSSGNGDRSEGVVNYGDTGGASRFFYVAKASKRDRNEGLDQLEAQRHADRQKTDGSGGANPRNRTNDPRQNFHPTVKPTSLMRQLIRLVTPPNGVVLDPFTGSGSTGKAAILEGFNFVGVELTTEYLPIIEGRLQFAANTVDNQLV